MENSASCYLVAGHLLRAGAHRDAPKVPTHTHPRREPPVNERATSATALMCIYPTGARPARARAERREPLHEIYHSFESPGGGHRRGPLPGKWFLLYSVRAWKNLTALSSAVLFQPLYLSSLSLSLSLSPPSLRRARANAALSSREARPAAFHSRRNSRATTGTHARRRARNKASFALCILRKSRKAPSFVRLLCVKTPRKALYSRTQKPNPGPVLPQPRGHVQERRQRRAVRHGPIRALRQAHARTRRGGRLQPRHASRLGARSRGAGRTLPWRF